MKDKKKKSMFIMILSIVGILSLTIGVSIAFFNYTRTGNVNTVSVGRVSFTSSQSGTINLTNVFPIKGSNAASDNINSSEVVITVTGDTTYAAGVEYLVSLDDVRIHTNTNKKVPVGIIVTPEKTGELGVANDNYFNNGVRGGNTSYYKVLAENTLEEDEYILVGYIRPGVAEVNGTIGIKAFIDADRIAISDTYDGTESDNNGTTDEWVDGRTVLTTTEWNNLNSSGISFKVRVEANEGIWVPEPTLRNDMKSGFPSIPRPSVTEINFIRMSEEMINTHADLYDLTNPNGQGMVKAWMDGTKLYVASPGETYFPGNSSGLFAGFTAVTNINFYNVNTSVVTSMSSMFYGDAGLTYLNLSNFGSNNLTGVNSMFSNCTNLERINMSNFNFGSASLYQLFFYLPNLVAVNLDGVNTSNVTNMGSLFENCFKLQSVDLSSFDTANVTDMSYMFASCFELDTIILKDLDFSSVTNMQAMFRKTIIESIDLSGITFNTNINMYYIFEDCSHLRTIYAAEDIKDYVNPSYGTGMFYGCTSLVGGAGTSTLNNYTGRDMAIIDGGSNNPGYLTLKTA